MATKVYTTAVGLKPTGTPGQFSVYSVGPGTYTITDSSDSALDNTAILGDVSGDKFVATNTASFRAKDTQDLVYYGETSGKQGLIGTFQNKNTQTSYAMYTNNSYSFNQIVNTDNGPFALCFCSGTLIRTSDGEVAVEDLRVGDFAVTVSGALRPITWIGHRHIEGEALTADQHPVRVRGGAFGGGLPARDLTLSPGHPVLVGAEDDRSGGVLVPVMCLINGTTIDRVASQAITYWHVELESHDILLAEGLPAESFLDFGCRAFFDEASDHALHNPDFIVPGLSARCRPVAVDGPLVETERARLDAVFAAGLTEHSAWDDIAALTWLATCPDEISLTNPKSEVPAPKSQRFFDKLRFGRWSTVRNAA
ncbi:Hint domain-containing protein [Methylobacterium sp. BTF04]|uniref:Hint domain-containing protein n=1 Tax=Methylobacterium sp. BTF04 TaxID=2708300 RepID=UPI001952E847|nr:Hint domain-containing protein [Methylobacterium sp. BTF04]